jgi:hypothetical protein
MSVGGINTEKESFLSHDTLLNTLDYDTTTGIFTNKYTRGRAKQGSISGCISKGKGYLSIMVNKYSYYAHRLAWFYVYKVWPEGFLDHINGNKLDNSISNLRECTQSQNMHNVAPRINKVGFRGVSSVRGLFQARITIDGVRKSLGYFKTAEEASSAYESKAKECFGEFYKTEHNEVEEVVLNEL